MKLSKLALLACPAFLVLILIAPNSAQAQELTNQSSNVAKSISSPPLVDIVFDRPTPKSSLANTTESSPKDDVPTLDFTDEESQAAMQRYGW